MSRQRTRIFVGLDKPSLKSASGCLSVEGKVLNYEVFCQMLNVLIFIDICKKKVLSIHEFFTFFVQKRLLEQKECIHICTYECTSINAHMKANRYIRIFCSILIGLLEGR